MILLKSLLEVKSQKFLNDNGDVEFKKESFEYLPSGLPKLVFGFYDLSDNANLISLKGSPREVHKSFYCHNNKNLTSLEFLPKVINEYVNISKCPKLYSDLWRLCTIKIKKQIFIDNPDLETLANFYRNKAHKIEEFKEKLKELKFIK